MTALLSELCLLAVFTLTLPFHFPIPSNFIDVLEVIVMVCVYVAISIPCVTGSIRLGLKLRTGLQNWRKKKYAVQPQAELGVEKLPVEVGTDTTLFAPTSRSLQASVLN